MNDFSMDSFLGVPVRIRDEIGRQVVSTDEVAENTGMLLGYLFTMTAHQQIATKIVAHWATPGRSSRSLTSSSRARKRTPVGAGFLLRDGGSARHGAPE